jgi:UDP-sugar pyrophosphorylase
VPEFVNPKYADAAKSVFKKAARLECMMQDHPKVLGAGARVGFTQFDDWTYSPVKNSVEEGRAKLAQGAPGRTAAEGELELYTAGARMLRAAGCALPPPAERSLAVFGFALAAPAIVVLGAAFAPSFSALRARFPAPAAVRIAPTAALVLEGDISVEALDLDGALVIRAAPGAHVRVARARVRNAGWAIVPLSEAEAAAASEAARIRGFRIEKRDTRELLFDAPGEYLVEDAAPAPGGEE